MHLCVTHHTSVFQGVTLSVWQLLARNVIQASYHCSTADCAMMANGLDNISGQSLPNTECHALEHTCVMGHMQVYRFHQLCCPCGP